MVLRIGNASGFYGDRFDAVREMLTGAGPGGELHVLTGDYLAELTMLILGRDQLKDPAAGYAKTFLRQMEEGLGLAHERGIRIVTNAGGLNPAGLADALRALAAKLGLPVRVAHVEGDRLPARDGALAANAYLGGAGIAACLAAGADVVVTGRVTDAALVTGPAQWHFGWGPQEYDRLAGAVVAGHVLECGTQATGGNYAFFRDHDPALLRRPGFPVAELHDDGSCVITKHPGTGGLVDVGTVTAQLLYETAGARYAGPDATARLDTVRLTQEAPDRVRIEGVRGEARRPPSRPGSVASAASATRSSSSSPGSTSRPRPRSYGTRSRTPSYGAGPARRRCGGTSSAPTGPTPPPRRPRAPCCGSSSATPARGRRPHPYGRRHRTGPRQLPRLPRHRPARQGFPYGVFETVYVDAAESRTRPCSPTGPVRGFPYRHGPASSNPYPSRSFRSRPPAGRPPRPSRPDRRGPQRRQGRRRQRGRVGAHGGGVALARPRPHRRAVPCAAARDGGPVRRPARAAEPAGPQLRRRRDPRRGRRL